MVRAGDLIDLYICSGQAHSLQAKVVILLTDNSAAGTRHGAAKLYVRNFSDSPINAFTAANALAYLVASSLNAHLSEAASLSR